MLNITEDQSSSELHSEDCENVIPPLSDGYFVKDYVKAIHESNDRDIEAWKQRQQPWYGHHVPLSPKNIRHLKNGGFIKEERRFAEYTKITSAWISHKDYEYEQRIDYRFERRSKDNDLGIKCIHIERTIQNKYRTFIECCRTEQYAELYTLLENAGLPVLQTHKWAMLPYSIQYTRDDLSQLKTVLSIIKSHTCDSVAPIIRDILQKFSTEY